MHSVYRNYRECSTVDSVTILFENESAISDEDTDYINVDCTIHG